MKNLAGRELLVTEKEKMLQGLLYYADADPELLAERARAKDLCRQSLPSIAANYRGR